MSKRNIAFTKPEDPSFLKRLKQQIGYKEGPTVDTKREELGPAEDLPDLEDDQPTVVVLHEGDLTAEEASKEKAKLEKEEAETPADLNSRIVFKPSSKSDNSAKKSSSETSSSTRNKSSSSSNGSKTESGKKVKSKALLSFDEDEEEEDDY